MEELIVLGLVPGTTIQIDFFVWLRSASIIVGIITIFLVHRHLTKYSYSIRITTASAETDKIANVVKPTIIKPTKPHKSKSVSKQKRKK